MTGHVLDGIGDLARSVPAESTQQAVGYPSLFLLVVLGSLVPVVPTGAVVSSAAVVAVHQSVPPLSLLVVFAVASFAAFLGDIALYWLGRRGLRSKNGSRWLAQIQGRAAPERLAQARTRLDEHGVAVLVLSRLLPAGRIPVMLACLLSRMPMRRFARGDAPAALAWAATYALIGILGGTLFARPWEGVAAAIALTVLVGAAPALRRRTRARREAHSEATG
ncbi:DedA family protein [Streptomyces lonegramiae]|uniref:VTT domain-containing protein n=1 Tax=Streptomyces lonegramiae TaxID=3075524 RepID=A0ABU2XPG8_9ACTN|nr:VTT domain-containing protein [Streptomyces sp. DSM 41529]MDT0547823.1 VTT domain-containing protein [Streptomyces sp. DSM 41529]